MRSSRLRTGSRAAAKRRSAVRARSAIALAALGAVAVVTGGFALQRLAAESPEQGAYRGSVPPRGIMLPDFTLSDQSGAPVRTGELDGKVVVVTFLESKCRESCPLVARQVGEALDRLDSETRGRVTALAVSTHPEDDTRASVRAFLRKYGVEEDLRYLIGSEPELRPVWDAFDVLPALDTGDPEMHSVPVRVFDPSGEWVATLHPGVDLTPENLAHDVRVALA